MKITIKRLELLKVLTFASQAIPVKSADKNCMNFLLEATDNSLIVIASDDTLATKVVTKMKDKDGKDVILALEKGKIQVPSRFLLDIVSKLNGDIVTLMMVDTNYLNISDDSTNFNLVTQPGEEYPDVNFNVPSSDNGITVSIGDLKSLFETTAFSVATKGPKDLYFGINVRAKDGKLYFLATDSYRLSRYSVADQNSDTSFSFNCPVKALQLVTMLNEKASCTIFFNEQSALFESEGTFVSTRLIRGDFPDPDRLIPASFPYSLTCNTDEFLGAADRVKIISDDKNSQVRLTFSSNGVILSSRSATFGDSQEVLKQASFTMPEGESIFEIGFNVNFVTEAIKALKSSTFTFVFGSPTRMFMVKNDNPENIQIITPIRITNFSND